MRAAHRSLPPDRRIAVLTGILLGSAVTLAHAAPCGTGVADAAVRVRAALHADRYFLDDHVNVALEDGRVVLRGFVASEWDLHDALRIARRAACDQPVVDNLSIKLGGRR